MPARSVHALERGQTAGGYRRLSNVELGVDGPRTANVESCTAGGDCGIVPTFGWDQSLPVLAVRANIEDAVVEACSNVERNSIRARNRGGALKAATQHEEASLTVAAGIHLLPGSLK